MTITSITETLRTLIDRTGINVVYFNSETLVYRTSPMVSIVVSTTLNLESVTGGFWV